MRSDNAVGIFELVADARSLSTEDFRAKHGSAFLMRTLDDGQLKSSSGFVHATTQISVQHPGAQSPRLSSPEATYVYPILKRSNEPGPVTVGRDQQNDICIDDTSLSGRHAELILDQYNQTITVIDRGSTNGTRIGGLRSQPGDPVSVQFGKTIAFGRVRVTCIPVEQLLDFITMTFEFE